MSGFTQTQDLDQNQTDYGFNPKKNPPETGESFWLIG